MTATRRSSTASLRNAGRISTFSIRPRPEALPQERGLSLGGLALLLVRLGIVRRAHEPDVRRTGKKASDGVVGKSDEPKAHAHRSRSKPALQPLAQEPLDGVV